MRTDARSDLIRAVDDGSTPAEKALWHAVVEMEEWVEVGLLVDPSTVQRLLDRVEAVLQKFSGSDPTDSMTKAEIEEGLATGQIKPPAYLGLPVETDERAPQDVVVIGPRGGCDGPQSAERACVKRPTPDPRSGSGRPLASFPTNESETPDV